MTSRGSAEFEIIAVFEIPNRGTVLAGRIRSGVVCAGMQVLLPLNSQLKITTTVTSVELIDHSDGRADVGLIIEDEDSFMAQLFQPGEVVSVREPAS
jgi:translation elongation factor EF-Tu-like GTPase